MAHHRNLAAAFIVAAAVPVIAPARADGFDARPITIETRDGPGSIVITNPGDRAIYLETRVFDWSQDAAGQNVLSESDTAIASPPATRVGPHATYNLRVKLPPGAPGRERAFRVVIEQIPDRDSIRAGQIVFALTQSLPAFVEPGEMSPPVLRARLLDALHILITNEGARRARIADITQNNRVVAQGLVGYALGHSSLAVALRSEVHPGELDFVTDLGRRAIDIR